MMKERIAIILERADVALGGAERSVFELARALRALGSSVDVLASKGLTQARDIHILCKDSPGQRTCLFSFAKALKMHIAENHYDIIHSTLPFDFADVYQPRGGCFAESVIRNAASYQNRFIEHYKKITAFANFRRTILLGAEKKLCRNPSGPLIAALSKYVCEQFKIYYGLDSERIKIIPNGIRTNKRIDLDEAGRLRTQIFVRLGIKQSDMPVFFLFVANNFRLKGLVPLIRAMHVAAVTKGGCKAYLIVAGREGSRKYHHLTRKLGVDRRIIFLGTIRHIQNSLSIVDVAVLPTFYDPSSRYILEALGAGKPVITTRFNGAVDLFVDNRHGKVIDTPENISGLGEAITYFTDMENIKKASQAIIEDNLKEKVSIERAAKQLKSVYESIIERRR